MRVLGVDPGLTRCGIGVIEGEPGRSLRLVATDVVRTDAGGDVAARLLALEAAVERWLREFRPDAVAVERVFSQRNVRTMMVTRLLRMPEPPRPADAADALALAICQLWRGEGQRRLARAVSTGTAGMAGTAGTSGMAGTAGTAGGAA